MSYDKRNFDKKNIKIRENNSYKKNEKKNDFNKKEFCFKMYNDWMRMNTPIDIPVLIMDNDNLIKNKDIEIIPRLYAKYIHKKINIPFVFCEDKNKYRSLNKYFNTYLNKEIPNINDFKKFLIEKDDLHENANLYESINIFLYTSFLLKQFSPVMNIVQYFYSPISDETKYYFYILFDYMRRDCIKKNIPLMKKEVIELIQKVASLDNKVLTEELFLNTFTFINESIFEKSTSFYLINENQTFLFSIEKSNISSEIKNNDNKKIF